MSTEFFKLLAPVAFIILWLHFSLRRRSTHYIGAALFFTSIVAFSQNFTFIYREIHQSIQVLMILAFLHGLITNKKIHKFNYLLLIILFFIGLSLLFSGIDDDASAQLTNFLVAIGVVNYLYNSISSTQEMRGLMRFIGHLSIATSAIGLLEYGANISQRIEVTFANPNYLAFFLGIGYCAVNQEAKGIGRSLRLALILFAIILSGSRSGLAFPLLYLIWNIYRERNLKKIITSCFIGLSLISIILISGVSRFSDSDASSASDAERIIFARIAYQMASEHPFTGVGWGRFPSEFANYSSDAEKILVSAGEVDVSDQDRRVTHNDFMRILAELGWIAFLASLLSLILGSIKILKQKNHELSFVAPAWLGSIIFSLTHNNLNGALFWFIFLMPFYFFGSYQSKRNMYFTQKNGI